MSLEAKVKAFLDEFAQQMFSQACEMNDEPVTLEEAINDRYSDDEDRYEYDGGDIRVTLESEYGGEGQGEEYWYVLKFTEGSKELLVRLNALYSSYVGAEYQDWDFVKPVQVLRTEYEVIK